MSEQLSIPMEIPSRHAHRSVLFTGKYDNVDDLLFKRQTLLIRAHFEPECGIEITKALKKTNSMLYELTGNPIYSRQ